MTDADKFFVAVLNAVSHGPFFNETTLWEKTKYKKIDYEKMISDIKEGQKNTAHCDKTGDPALFNMITKSLALLTQFPHGHDTELATEYKLPKQELEKYLIKLWGKSITEHEYHSILNQC